MQKQGRVALPSITEVVGVSRKQASTGAAFVAEESSRASAGRSIVAYAIAG